MARLLFVSGTAPDVRGGSGTFVGISVLRRALLEQGHEIEILAPRAQSGPVSLPGRLLFNLRARAAAPRLARDADAIVGFDLDGVFLPRGRALRIAAIKGVAADEARFERGAARTRLAVEASFEKRHVRRADRVITTSAYSAERIVAEYGVDAERIAVVPEPIDLARWEQALARARPPSQTETKSILCVAHLYPRKDVATLLAAAASLPDVILRVVGTGPQLPSLRRQALRLGLGARAEFLGHVSFERLVAEYGRADVFCLPSRQEGFGIVFLEAMAAGIPIVAARAGAVPEVVAHDECGTLLEPGDPVALAATLQHLLEDSAERRRLGEGGRRRVRRWDAPAVARHFVDAIGLEGG